MIKISRFDYEEITPSLINSCVSNINSLAQSKVMKPNNPNQTHDWLFDSEMCFWNDKWKTLRNTFLQSVKTASGISFNNYKAWAYVCLPGVEVDYDAQWHSHKHSIISGVLYLTLPKDSSGASCATTEFLDESGTFITNEPVIGSWFIFDSKMVHRPGLWKHSEMKENRICLAASVW